MVTRPLAHARRRAALAFLCSLAMLSSGPAAQTDDATGIKTTHRFFLASAADEAELRSILAEFNELLEAGGLPSPVYRIWRSEARPAGRTEYLWESDWPDRATYQEMHARPEYRALVQRHMTRIGQLLLEHEYTRYEELSLP